MSEKTVAVVIPGAGGKTALREVTIVEGSTVQDETELNLAIEAEQSHPISPEEANAELMRFLEAKDD